MYKGVDWTLYAVHDANQVAGFFGEYRWLSNFHLHPVTFEGVIYPSNEHAYHAAKWPREDRLDCLDMTAAKVKNWGRKAPITAPEWEAAKTSVMCRINKEKYSDPELAQKLLDTEWRELVELNHWHDNFYGCDYRTPERGKNNLGKILMAIRYSLRYT